MTGLDLEAGPMAMKPALVFEYVPVYPPPPLTTVTLPIDEPQMHMGSSGYMEGRESNPSPPASILIVAIEPCVPGTMV